MKPFTKTEKGIYVRTNELNWQLPARVGQYANTINEKCMPIIKELGLNFEDIKAVIRYSCKGGTERMRSDFLADVPDNNSFRKIAERQFDVILKSHPEYEECANTWRWANLLCIEDGLVAPDHEAIEKSNEIYISDSDSIEFVEKLQKVAKALNSVFPSHTPFPYGVFRQFFLWDTNAKEWVLNPRYLSDEFILFHRKSITPFSKPSRDEIYMQRSKQKGKAIVKAAIQDFGFEGKEAEEMAKSDE